MPGAPADRTVLSGNLSAMGHELFRWRSGPLEGVPQPSQNECFLSRPLPDLFVLLAGLG